MKYTIGIRLGTVAVLTACTFGWIFMPVLDGSKPVGKIIRIQGCYLPEEVALWGLVKSSDAIVIGTVQEILREDASPIGDTTSNDRITLYGVSVERYLKGSGPKTVKVRQPGGTFAGTTVVYEDDPRLQVGKRHILFLCCFKQFRSLGYIPTGHAGAWKYDGDADEYRLASRVRGKVVLDNGVTDLPFDPLLNKQPERWQFAGGPQLLGITEEEAIGRIIAERDRFPKLITK